MERSKLIDGIESLFPPDSVYDDTREIGEGIMLKALALEWRNLPDDFLYRMLLLCQEEDGA